MSVLCSSRAKQGAWPDPYLLILQVQDQHTWSSRLLLLLLLLFLLLLLSSICALCIFGSWRGYRIEIAVIIRLASFWHTDTYRHSSGGYLKCGRSLRYSPSISLVATSAFSVCCNAGMIVRSAISAFSGTLFIMLVVVVIVTDGGVDDDSDKWWWWLLWYIAFLVLRMFFYLGSFHSVHWILSGNKNELSKTTDPILLKLGVFS